jgi:hypothetical protein
MREMKLNSYVCEDNPLKKRGEKGGGKGKRKKRGEKRSGGGKEREKGYGIVVKMEGPSALWSWCPSP